MEKSILQNYFELEMLMVMCENHLISSLCPWELQPTNISTLLTFFSFVCILGSR